MPTWMKFVLMSHLLRAPEGDPPGGGGAPAAPTLESLAKDNTELRSMNAKLLERFEKLEKAGTAAAPTPKTDDADLAAKAAKERETLEAKANRDKALTSAVKFTMNAPAWLKTNESLLPKSIAGIFAQAEKENYTDEIEKDCAIKVGIISEFFAEQANLDLLTDSQKSTIEDFRKLIKTVKQERAQQVYDSIFEPTFEALKRVKKAELISKGHGGGSDSTKAYKEKLIKGSAKHHLGETK